MNLKEVKTCLFHVAVILTIPGLLVLAIYWMSK